MAVADIIGRAGITIEPDMSAFKKSAAVFAAAGAAAGALIVAGIGEAMEQANVKSMLQAQLGSTDAVAAKQGKVAGELYTAGITDSFQESADAIKAVMQAGLAPPDATKAQLKSIATQASDVAKTFGQDLGGVTNSVSQMIKTGLAVNSSQAFNIITKGFQLGNDKAGDLLDTINEYGTQFRKAGVDGQQAMGLISQGLKAGARDADLVADAIKEFSIRAVDGSTASAQGFNDLGLSGVKMAAGFAKGGKTANAVLDITLDRLRNVEDPVKRSRIAVSLFGTQAEDLGDALFAIDPSEATKKMAGFQGATARLGKALHSGPTHELTVFWRTLKQAFIDVLANQVLPVIVTAAKWVNTNLLPPLTKLSQILAGTLVPSLMHTIAAIKAIVNWFKMMATWLIPIGILITGLTISMTLNAIAAGAQAAAIMAVTIAMRIARGITLAMTAAQWLFNAAMNANPLVLIVTLIIAFVAAIVVAYHRSETFRAIVQAMWSGIKTAAAAAWAFIKPIFTGIWTAMKAVGSAALWLWQNAIKPAFDGIWLVIRLTATVIGVLLYPFYLLFKKLGEGALWLYEHAVKPAFFGIMLAVRFVWETVIRPIFRLWIFEAKLVGAGAMLLWKNAIKPAWDGIKLAISVGWSVMKSIFTSTSNYLRNVLSPAFKWVGDKIRAAWNGAKNAIAVGWSLMRPVFDKVKESVHLVKLGFDIAVRGISKVWNGLVEVFKKPVRIMVNVVYNKGIVPIWNKVADITNVGKLKPVKFAEGGRTRGGQPGKDSIPILAMADEFMINRRSARKIGYGNLAHMNRTGQLPGFEDGGLIGWGKSAASAVGGAISDAASLAGDLFSNPLDVWKKLTGPIRKMIKDQIGGNGWANMIAKVPGGILSGLGKKIKDSIGSIGGMFGLGDSKVGGGVKRWTGVVQQSLRMLGQPAGYTAITLRRMNQESGGNPLAVNRTDSNWQAGHPSVGLMQVIGPTFAAYAGAMRKTGPFMYGTSVNPLANVYSSMRYALAAYGSLPSAYNRAGGYDNGGWLPTGLSLAYNGTGRPERIRNPQQEAALSRNGMTLQLVVENHGVIGSQHETDNWLAKSLENLDRQGRLRSIVNRALGRGK